jgi:hypothetical protein
MIDDIPETAFDLEVITPVQKQLYKEVLNTVYSKCLLPTAHKLRESV